MRFLTTEKERQVIMDTPRQVSKTEKILFPIVVTIIVSLTLPDAAILVGLPDDGQPDERIRRGGAHHQDRRQ